jgi:hypothetical protein
MYIYIYIYIYMYIYIYIYIYVCIYGGSKSRSGQLFSCSLYYDAKKNTGVVMMILLQQNQKRPDTQYTDRVFNITHIMCHLVRLWRN